MPIIWNAPHICPRCRNPRDSWTSRGRDAEYSLQDTAPAELRDVECKDKCNECSLPMRGRVVLVERERFADVTDESFWVTGREA